MNDLAILKQIEENLGIPRLKEVQPGEILPPAKRRFFWGGLPYYLFHRGYSLDRQKRVTGLNISFCNLNPVLPLISRLQYLEYLNIEHSRVDDPAFISLMTQLKGINARFTFLNTRHFIKGLKNLFSLDLSSTNISDISMLKELKNLSSLDLS